MEFSHWPGFGFGFEIEMPPKQGESKLKFPLKCCAAKTHGYWCCITCLGLFHPSCLDRDFKNHSMINGNRIYCSTECEQAGDASRMDQVLRELQQKNHALREKLFSSTEEFEFTLAEKEDLNVKLTRENEQLKQDMKLQEAQYIRHRQKWQDFEKETIEQEQKIAEELGNKRVIIADLRSKLQKNFNQKTSLDNALKTQLEMSEKLQKDLDELNIINRNMLVSIEALEAENKSCHLEMDRLRTVLEDRLRDTSAPHTVDALNEGLTQRHPGSLFDELSAADSHMIGSSPVQLRRDCFSAISTGQPVPGHGPSGAVGDNVLVFGDRSANGVAAGLLRYLSPLSYSIVGESHHGYSLSRMADTIFRLTTGFGARDSVVVCINLDSSGRLNSYHLNKLLSIGKYTNLIFSLTDSSLDARNYANFAHVCQEFLRYQIASIRVFNNNRVGSKFRLSKRSLCKNLSDYVNCSLALKNVFVTSYIKCVNGLDAEPTYAQILAEKNGENSNLNYSFLDQNRVPSEVPSVRCCNLAQLTRNENSNSSNLAKSKENENENDSTNYSNNDSFLVLSPIPKKNQ